MIKITGNKITNIMEMAETYQDLKGFEEYYEISINYPYSIRNKKTNKIVSEYTETTGYIRLNLNGSKYHKHRLVAKQFINNPNNLSCVDHINHNRTDNRISNLRWISYSENNKNKTSNNNIIYTYFDYADFDDEDMIQVNEYNNHEFENYYYNPNKNKFYFDNGVNYRELHINYKKDGLAFVNMVNTNNKFVNVYYNKFKKMYDFI